MLTTTVPRISVLIVEDDPAQARWLTRVLTRHAPEDVDIQTYTDACEAHAHLREHWTDVLISDLDMPGADGIELVRQAKQLNPWVQSLVLTAASTSSALMNAGDIGATDYLVKPVGEELLAELLDQSVNRLRRWRQSLSVTLLRSRSQR
jgi:DNA-binding NtrC family response regulator